MDTEKKRESIFARIIYVVADKNEKHKTLNRRKGYFLQFCQLYPQAHKLVFY